MTTKEGYSTQIHQRNIMLQAILFFMLCKNHGLNQSDAEQEFRKSEIARCFKNLTIGELDAIAKDAGYEDNEW